MIDQYNYSLVDRHVMSATVQCTSANNFEVFKEGLAFCDGGQDIDFYLLLLQIQAFHRFQIFHFLIRVLPCAWDCVFLLQTD